MAVRSGSDYLESLRNSPREVWISGELITDVTKNIALAPMANTIASLFDMQLDPAYSDILTTKLASGDAKIGTSYLIPYSYEDIVKRRKATRIWTEKTFGMVSRTPDYTNSGLMGLAQGRQFLDNIDPVFGSNLQKYFEYARANELFLAQATVSPPNDRSKASFEQADPTVHLHIVRERSDGLVISGAKMLATLGPLADEIMVFDTHIARQGDERYSMAFAIPTGANGISQICRTPFENTQSPERPLSSRFDEIDSLVIFENVIVPWDRVFYYHKEGRPVPRGPLFQNSDWFSHTAHQTAIRLLVKMELLAGIVIALAQSVRSDQFTNVQLMISECLQFIEIIRACLARSEVECEIGPGGGMRPLAAPLQLIRTKMPDYYPRIVEIIQTIGAGALLMLPSSKDTDGSIQATVAKFFAGADGVTAKTRIALLRLAWDISGDAFGTRQLQYERYFAGDPVKNKIALYYILDKSESNRLLNSALSLGSKSEDKPPVDALPT